MAAPTTLPVSARNSKEAKEADFRLEDADHPSIAPADEPVIPKGYWTSTQFLGSSIAIILLGNTLFFGYAVPVNLLNLINADLGPSPNIYLVTLVNTLIKGVGSLLIGALSDVFGRRYFIIGGQVCGFLGAVLSATSKSIDMLVGATVFTGLAGCGQLLFPVLAQEIVPNKYRGWVQAGVMFLTLPGSGFGPIIGRSLVETTGPGGWRYCYWLNAALNGFSVVLFAFCYFPPGYHDLHSRRGKMDLLKRIDFLGFLLYASGLICLLLALAWGGKQYTWTSATIIGLLVGGPIILIVFVLYELYGRVTQPLLPMSLFSIRNFNIAVVVGSVGQMSFYALNILWPTHITQLYTTNNYLIGWMSCTTGLALSMGEAITGPLLKRLGNIRWQYVLSVAGLMLFTGLMYLANENRQSMAVALTVVIGLFIGWVELVAIVVAGLVIPPETIGTGQAFFSSTRAVTGTISTSIYLSIYTNRLSASTPAEVSSYAQDAGLPSSSLPQLFAAIANGTAAARQAVPGMNSVVSLAVDAGVKRAYSTSLGTVYLTSLAFGGIAFICSWFATDIGGFFTSFVNKKVDLNKKQEVEPVTEKTV